MAVDVLLGLQWGDEGKGKIVDYLAPKYDLIARFQGGPNAGHTLKVGDSEIVLHTVPSGIFHGDIMNLIGSGVVVDPHILKSELDELIEMNASPFDNLMISSKAHLILPSHRILDAAQEAAKGELKIGSTLKGIGPTYTDKTARNGLRVGEIYLKGFDEVYNKLKAKHLKLAEELGYEYDIDELENDWMESLETLRKIKMVSSEYMIDEYLSNDRQILAEGAQGSMLDVDYGTYPFVTSSNTVTAAACIGLGFSPHKIKDVYGISKAYCTRVGSGPFPTQLDDEDGQRLREVGREFGATTGRPRRTGWVDLVALNYTIMLNGVNKLILTKLDVMNDFDEIKVATAYRIGDKITKELPYDLEDENLEPVYETYKGWGAELNDCNNFSELPESANAFVDAIEEQTRTEVFFLSTGPGRDELILKGVTAE